jgi:hypothetical protein
MRACCCDPDWQALNSNNETVAKGRSNVFGRLAMALIPRS